jgi:hypothetical protein
MKEFYMVYVEGQGAPTYKHDTLESAITESRRLAKHLDRKAFVLRAILAVELNQFKETPLGNNDGIPF